MTDPRFIPSASVLLAIAACWPEFPLAVPHTIESLTSLLSPWGGEEGGESVGEAGAGDDTAPPEPGPDAQLSGD